VTAIEDADEDNNNGPTAGPKTLSTVELAQCPGEFPFNAVKF